MEKATEFHQNCIRELNSMAFMAFLFIAKAISPEACERFYCQLCLQVHYGSSTVVLVFQSGEGRTEECYCHNIQRLWP